VTYRRLLLVCLAVGLLASLFVALRRELHEHRANRVEIVMDDQDFSALAQSYAYDQRAFLIALRRAGLTSLAVAEELGSAVPASSSAAEYTGTALLDQARLTGLRDPIFAGLAASHQLRADEVYLVAYDDPTARRYAQQLPLKFSARAVRLIHAGLPAVYELRTQPDYFGTVGLGLPEDRVALARSLALHLVPRLQNDERFKAPQIDALLRDATAGNDAHTVIFFGLRNQVLGYPDALDATAAAMRADRLDFGTVETYDVKQIQAGTEGLRRSCPTAPCAFKRSPNRNRTSCAPRRSCSGICSAYASATSASCTCVHSGTSGTAARSKRPTSSSYGASRRASARRGCASASRRRSTRSSCAGGRSR
jgi:hypothetical protein